MDRTINLNDLINNKIECSCGHTHYTSVKRIEIELDAVKKLPVFLKEFGYKKIFIVADKNTWAAAGASAAAELKKAGINFKKIILENDEVVPDERIIGEIITAYPMDTDLVLAVGSGTINDLCKFVSHRMGVDYVILASAPSMDGFVSIGAALMLKHVKTTIDCHGPVAVFGDTKILSQAPMRLIAAGLGDTLGKYTCLLDWKLSHLINGEYYCPEIVSLVETALKTVKEQSKKVKQRDPEAIQAVMEALVLTGIAMSFSGNSRPASGCEHHLSHYWEMTMLMNGDVPALHGLQVGVGMILAASLYHKLTSETPDFEAARTRPYDRQAWETEIRKVYGSAAPGIIELEDRTHKNDITARNRRIDMIEKNWAEIQKMIDHDLPDIEDMIELMRSLDAPITPRQIGISDQETYNAVLYAKEVRDRYTLLQILWNLGLSAPYAEDTVEFFKLLERES